MLDERIFFEVLTHPPPNYLNSIFSYKTSIFWCCMSLTRMRIYWCDCVPSIEQRTVRSLYMASKFPVYQYIPLKFNLLNSYQRTTICTSTKKKCCSSKQGTKRCGLIFIHYISCQNTTEPLNGKAQGRINQFYFLLTKTCQWPFTCT
jgi:hypothetical protein